MFISVDGGFAPDQGIVSVDIISFSRRSQANIFIRCQCSKNMRLTTLVSINAAEVAECR